jgi:hypothetical protein
MVRPVGHSPKIVEMSGDLVASVVDTHGVGPDRIPRIGKAHKPLNPNRVSLHPHDATAKRVAIAFRTKR